MGNVRIVCLSDTHNRQSRIDVPDGDLLLHAGDFTMGGRRSEIESFNAWLGTLPHRHKIAIAGNHDWMFERNPPEARALLTNAVYLQDTETTVEGLRIWGSPWQPEFFDWAFNLPRGEPLAAKWRLIPTGVDILVTHGPPAGIGDRVSSGESVGCHDLARELRRVRPRLHLFGHIHEAYGLFRADGTIYVNASICDEGYDPSQAPIVIDL
jgi:predicted phosphohydrolase